MDIFIFNVTVHRRVFTMHMGFDLTKYNAWLSNKLLVLILFRCLNTQRLHTFVCIMHFHLRTARIVQCERLLETAFIYTVYCSLKIYE